MLSVLYNITETPLYHTHWDREVIEGKLKRRRRSSIQTRREILRLGDGLPCFEDTNLNRGAKQKCW